MRPMHLVSIALALSLTGCAVTEPEPSVVPVDYEVCFLTGVSTFEDSTLNQALDISMHQAQIQYGVKIQVAELESGAKSSVISRQARIFAGSGCNLVVGSGPGAQPAFESVAKANPNTKFLLLDGQASEEQIRTGESGLDNLSVVDFNEWSAAFEAGYLAALQAEAVVGIWHLAKAADANTVLSGFRSGVEFFNQENGSVLEILVSRDLSKLGRADVILATHEISALEADPRVWLYLEKQPQNLLIDSVKQALTGDLAGTVYLVTKSDGYLGFSTKILPSGSAGQISRIRELLSDGSIVEPR